MFNTISPNFVIKTKICSTGFISGIEKKDCTGNFRSEVSAIQFHTKEAYLLKEDGCKHLEFTLIQHQIS